MKELKYLKYFVSSFLFLAAFAICFLVAFVKNQLIYFLIAAVLVTLFLVIYSISTKKITTKDGYTLAQAYFFYIKCCKQGIYNASGILDSENLTRMQPIADACEYAKNLNARQLKRLYADGWAVAQYVGKIKRKYIKR